jgi:hypothetical protein
VALISEAGAREVSLPGFLQSQAPDGFFIATCFEFAAETKLLVRAYRALERSSASATPTLLLAIRATKSGSVADLRHAVLLEGSPVTQCVDVDLREDKAGYPWPTLEVRFASFHRGADWTGGIEWKSVIETVSMSTTNRMPLRLWKQVRGGEAVVHRLQVTEVGQGFVEIRSLTTERVVRLPCGNTCAVPPEEVLRSAW